MLAYSPAPPALVRAAAYRGVGGKKGPDPPTAAEAPGAGPGQYTSPGLVAPG